jgi:formylglycine-generating enzyme required for sulfatase activity
MLSHDAAQADGGEDPQVFVSYSRADAEPVSAITRLLEDAGVTVWRDCERILGGQYFGEAIVHAIAHSRVLLLMCSPHSFESENVFREVALTWDYHKRYLPVWISAPVEVPARLRYALVSQQWVEAHSGSPEQWLPRLLMALAAMGVDITGSPQKPGAPARGDSPGAGRRPGLRFKRGDRPILGTDWVLESLLGKGGFGEVWKAHYPHLRGQPPVALKFCLHLDTRARELLRHEADMVLQAQKQIRSGGIVPLVHAYLNNDPPCLEYPYIEGGTLVRLLEECRRSPAGSFTPAQVERIILQIARIVGQAHRANPCLVHRDLKPSNVLVERLAETKIKLRVTDFGIGGLSAQPALERSRSSSSLEADVSAVLTGAYSPLYASPQQMRGEKPDPRDDVYALGVIWHQLLTGDLTSPAPTGRRWGDGLLKRGVSEAALDVLSSCFESDPVHRPDDAVALAENLEAITRSRAKTLCAPEIITTVAGLIELKLIPAGEFDMGSGEGQGAPDEQPRHCVRITRAFYLGVHEVTQGQYAAVTGKNHSYFCSSGGGKDKVAGAPTDSYPVERVSWLDAVLFCNKLSEKEGLIPFYQVAGERVTVSDSSGDGYRLPTEAEWEYASGSDPADLSAAAWFDANAGGCTHPVGQKRSNRFGLCDMLGNVWEWCWDAYAADFYKRSPSEDPRGPTEASNRVIRGGCWGSAQRDCRSASRGWSVPARRNDLLGFRVARGQSDRSKAGSVPKAEPPGVVGSEPAKNGPKSPPERVDARTAEATRKVASPEPAKTVPAPAKRPAVAKAADVTPRGAPEIITTVAGRIKLKLIPAGEFEMGSGEGQGDSDERPRHRVRITRAFYLGVHEVTQGQYAAVTGKNHSYFCSSGGGKNKVAGAPTDSHPVEHVSWLAAVLFCNYLSEKESLKPLYHIARKGVTVSDWNAEGYRLPTEAEWEYASGGDPADLSETAWFDANAGGCTHPVGQKRSNRFGLCDILGNVWEWCWDAYDADFYKQSSLEDPRGPTEATYRVIRGGCWGSAQRDCRSASRGWSVPARRNDLLGFRVARGQSDR